MSSKPEHIIRLDQIPESLGNPKEFLLGNSEKELVLACKKGHRMAQKRVYELFSAKMLNVCRRYARSQDEARDLMHDGFIKVFLNIRDFRSEASLETWITRIMINNSISSIRKEVRKGIHVDVEKAPPQREEAFDFELESRKPISARNVFDTLQELPLGYRTVISLYVLDNFTHKEIAAKLDISEGTSKSQLAKGRRLLSKLLKEKYQ